MVSLCFYLAKMPLCLRTYILSELVFTVGALLEAGRADDSGKKTERFVGWQVLAYILRWSVYDTLLLSSL